MRRYVNANGRTDADAPITSTITGASRIPATVSTRPSPAASQASTPLVAETITHPAAAMLAEIWSLFWQTYEHGQTKFERFTPAVFDRFAEHDEARWLTLRDAASGAMVAFMLITRRAARQGG